MEDINIIEQVWLEVYGEDMRFEYPGFFDVLDNYTK